MQKNVCHCEFCYADVTVGFELTAVLTEETVETVTLVVSVLDGDTTTPITVAFTTQNGTATSKLCSSYLYTVLEARDVNGSTCLG